MKAIFAGLILVIASPCFAQQPTNCAVGGFIVSPDSTIWVCAGIGSPAVQVQTGGGGVPSGSILLIDSGSCPAGYSEVAGVNGRMLLGTVTANGNVGSTGGSDTITPAGVNSGGAVSAHSGTAVADHAAHTHTFAQSANAATPDLVTANVAAAGVAASGTTGNPNATLTHSVTQPAAHTFTQPTFAGAQFDNRSAFVRVIACRKT